MINVFPTPIANFSTSPSGVVPSNTSVTFTDASTNGGIEFWDFADPSSGINNNSSASAASHSFASEGTYCVTLISSNVSGCSDTTQECIEIANDATFSIPNVFTPNGDGNNDLFFITATSIKELTCSIYDRWGLKIAEWNTINGGWDGRTTSGTIATDGVYYYIMKATAINDKITEKQGFIQLLKDK
jgi:gliding motility-associated-like protein